MAFVENLGGVIRIHLHQISFCCWDISAKKLSTCWCHQQGQWITKVNWVHAMAPWDVETFYWIRASTCWWRQMKNQRLTKVIRVHLWETMKGHGNPFNSCWNISVQLSGTSLEPHYKVYLVAILEPSITSRVPPQQIEVFPLLEEVLYFSDPSGLDSVCLSGSVCSSPLSLSVTRLLSDVCRAVLHTNLCFQ